MKDEQQRDIKQNRKVEWYTFISITNGHNIGK